MSFSINSTLSTFRTKQSSTSRPSIIGQYKIDKTIGKGTFGKVKLGIHIQTQEPVAIKIIEKHEVNNRLLLTRIGREINYLKSLSHLNIIQLYEVIENSNCIYLIMEYANGGDLFNYIFTNGRLTEEEAANFFIQILHGIEAIHKAKLCHRDIKPENILLTDKKTLKIIDFGLSNEYSQNLSSACGSFCYASPELVQGSKYDGLKVDLWSSGIILFAMVCGYLPFEDQNIEALTSKIIQCKIDFPNDADINLSSQCKDLIRRMLVADPSKRLTVEEIKQHRFLEENNKKYEGLAKNEEYASNRNLKQMIIDKMVNVFNCKRKEVLSSLENNKFNSIATLYKLLRRQYIEGFQCEANVSPVSRLNAYTQDAMMRSNHYNSAKISKPPKESSVACRIARTSLSSNNSIILDLDNAIQESNEIEKSNLIIMNRVNMAPKPLKMASRLNRLISSVNTNKNNFTDKTVNASTSLDKQKRRKSEVAKSKSKPKPSSSIQQSGNQALNNRRYLRNRFPLTSLYTANQTLIYKKSTIDEIKPLHTDRQKDASDDPIAIPESIKKPLKTSNNSKRNSKDKFSFNLQKTKRKLNTLVFSNDIQSKFLNSTSFRRSNNISSHHSPFKSELVSKQLKETPPMPKPPLLSETELNKIATDLCNKKPTPSKNRLLIIQKPKNDLFALCTSKYPRHFLEKSLKTFCDNNKLSIVGGPNSNNCYVLSINTADKFVIEISLCDNLTLLKFYHLKGNENITKEYIKKIIVNVGF